MDARIREVLGPLLAADLEPESPGPEAAVAILFASGGPNGPAVLFMERAARPLDPWSGQISLPGGRREAEDACLEDTARRETAEEVGVALAPRSAFGRLAPLQAWKRGAPTNLWVHTLLFAIDEVPSLCLGAEAASARWISLRALLDSRAQTTHIARPPAEPVAWPALWIPPYLIWGLTRRILGEALPVLSLNRHRKTPHQ